MDQTWIKKIKLWIKYGSNMGLRNKNNGSNMDQIWCSRIKIMDQTWIQYGSSQFPRNKNNELNMDQMQCSKIKANGSNMVSRTYYNQLTRHDTNKDNCIQK